MERDENKSAHLHRHVSAKETPWLRTFLTQAALFLCLFAAINIGQPQIKVTVSSAPDLEELSRFGPSTDFYFVSVAGGSRPIESQSRLLKQVCVLSISLIDEHACNLAIICVICHGYKVIIVCISKGAWDCYIPGFWLIGIIISIVFKCLFLLFITCLHTKEAS